MKSPIDIHREELSALCRRHGICRLTLFGSWARGEAGADSDVDLMFRLRPDIKLGFGLRRVREQFEETLGLPVDFVSERGFAAHWLEHMLEYHDVIYDEAA